MREEAVDAGSAGRPRTAGARARVLAEYAGAAALSIALAVFTLRLWRADLRVPFDYRGDALLLSMVVKSVVENGSILTIPQLGAPGVFDLHDDPFALDWGHLLAIKALTLFSSNWAVVFNLYFLLGFPLITISALAVFRHFRVPFAPALVGSILYAFLPSRLIKGEAHLFHDNFYAVPLGMLVVLWVCSDAPPLVAEPAGSPWPPLDLRRGRSIAALLLCAIVAAMCTCNYYAFFTGFLLVVGGIWASVERRTLRNAFSGMLLAAALLAGMVADVSPSLIYRAKYGVNARVTERAPAEAEIYGMKIVQLLLPVREHRIAAFRHLTADYSATAPLVNENSVTSLGVMGSLGFLTLLAMAFSRTWPERPRDELLRPLSVLNLAAVLFATIGGFGSLFAWLITPQFRAYMRMNVVIAFLALFAFVLLLERLGRRWPRLAGLSLVILAVGLLDQVTPAAMRQDEAVKAEFEANAELVRRIESATAPGAMIFELPYVTYQYGKAHQMMELELLRPYLHSRTLRWTFPSMPGRCNDLRVSEIAGLRPPQLLRELSDAGFDGVLLARSGYGDNGAAIESEIGRLVEARPEVGQGGRLAFFPLTGYRRRTESEEPREELERRREMARNPLCFRWAAGFYDAEVGPNGPFRWAGRAAQLEIDNEGRAPKWASISLPMAAAHPPSRLEIDGDLLSENIELPAGAALLARTFGVPPGHHVLRFRCQGKPADVPSEKRTLIWSVENPVLKEVMPP